MKLKYIRNGKNKVLNEMESKFTEFELEQREKTRIFSNDKYAVSYKKEITK